MTNKKTTKKTSKKQAPVAPRRRRWLGLVAKFMVVMAIVLGGYMVYLDGIVRARMEGPRWQLPAQVMSRPLQLQLGSPLYAKNLYEELNQLKYRRATANRPGNYHGNQQQAVIQLLPEALIQQQGHTLLVDFEQGRVKGLRLDGQPVTAVAFKPVELDRLLSGNREDRVLAHIDDVPETLINALLLIEDRDFYEHAGVSPESIARAFLANIKAGHTVQGGSTLTQQLAKNLFLTRQRSLLRKAKEALIAILLDFHYSKRDLLETYLNEIYMGQNGAVAIHGFATAALFYFNRPLSALSIDQQAMLVAMVKGPGYYDPWRHPKRLLQRRDLVLRVLFDNDLLDRHRYEQLASRGLGVQPRAQAALARKPALNDALRRELQQKLPTQQQRDGMRIVTTIDPSAQYDAEQAVLHEVPRLAKQRNIKGLQVAMVVTDVDSGEIRALVSDRNPAFAGFNRVLDARRPVGSLLKPVLLAQAFAGDHYTLASPLEDRPIFLRGPDGQRWQPQNFDKTFRGQVSLLYALEDSLNVPMVNLAMKLGVNKVGKRLHDLGYDGDEPFYPASVLGALPMSPLQIAQVYNTLADRGRYQPLTLLRGIYAQDRSLLWRNEQRPEPAISAENAYLVDYGLQRVTRYGTAHALGKKFYRFRLAGKTGTTDDLRDSWFAGMDGRELVIVWLGRDDNQSVGLTGSAGAMKVYEDYLQRRGVISRVTSRPAGIADASFDKQGQQVTPDCEGSVRLPLKREQLKPASRCEAQPAQRESDQDRSWWQKLFGD